MRYHTMHKTRARTAAKMIRARLAQKLPDAGIELIKHWPETGIKTGKVAAYIPIGTEIDVWPLMWALSERGYGICLPQIRRKARPLVFRDWHKGDRLKPGPYGTREPLKSAPQCQPEIILVPLLAFSWDGHRLGYGGGYYDRTLTALRSPKRAGRPIFACGIAYSGQEVPTLPTDSFDQKLDGVLTETGFRRFS